MTVYNNSLPLSILLEFVCMLPLEVTNLSFALPGYIQLYLKLRKRCNLGPKKVQLLFFHKKKKHITLQKKKKKIEMISRISNTLPSNDSLVPFFLQNLIGHFTRIAPRRRVDTMNEKCRREPGKLSSATAEREWSRFPWGLITSGAGHKEAGT